jgi:hypothetical protein
MVVRVEGVRPQPGRRHRLCCALPCRAVLCRALLARPGHGWGARGLQQCLGARQKAQLRERRGNFCWRASAAFGIRVATVNGRSSTRLEDPP